jgi:hypothetical protein
MRGLGILFVCVACIALSLSLWLVAATIAPQL